MLRKVNQAEKLFSIWQPPVVIAAKAVAVQGVHIVKSVLPDGTGAWKICIPGPDKIREAVIYDIV
jgi:hypothetical protein